MSEESLHGRSLGDSSGSAAAIGLLVGLLVFASVFAVVIKASHEFETVAPDNSEEPDLEAEGDFLVKQVLGTPGQGWYSGPCTGMLPDPGLFTPEAVTRLGLAGEPCTLSARMNGLNLSYEKIKNLRRAGLAANPANGALDYAEARDSLEIEGRDFHLTTRIPVHDSRVLLERGYLDPNMRALYLGDYIDPPGPRPPEPAASVRPEAKYLAALVQHFTPNVRVAAYDHPTFRFDAQGDVFPDFKDPMNDEFPPLLVDNWDTPGRADNVGTLRHYNVLVVGSNVDHTAMTSEDAKDAVDRWVRAGGLLIVFGSANQNVNWLQPLFHSSLRGSDDAAPSVLQPDHKLLTRPNLLQPGAYNDEDQAWDLGSQSEADFDILATRDDNPADPQEGSVLVSKEGHHGNGRIVLSAWLPFDATGTGPTGPCDPDALAGDCAGLQMIQNFLTVAYDSLRVDYGPPVPSGQIVAEFTRLVAVYHPEMQRHIEVEFVLHVW